MFEQGRVEKREVSEQGEGEGREVFEQGVRLAIMIFIPLNQFVVDWLIRKVHSVVLQSGNCTEHP